MKTTATKRQLPSKSDRFITSYQAHRCYVNNCINIRTKNYATKTLFILLARCKWLTLSSSFHHLTKNNCNYFSGNNHFLKISISSLLPLSNKGLQDNILFVPPELTSQRNEWTISNIWDDSSRGILGWE